MEHKLFKNTGGKITAVLGLAVNYLWGGWDLALRTLLIFMLVDYLTGVICGYYNKELSSVRAFEGIIKKIFILTMVTVATQLDYIADAEGYMRSLVVFYYIGVELISIVENASHFIPVPQELIDSLEQIQKGERKERKEQ